MKNNLFPILPSNNKFIGILGGGQLGKMISIAATNLGYSTYLYCPEGDNPAEEVVTKIIHGSWKDYEKIDYFASQVVCATSEFENIPSETLKRLEQKTYVYPKPLAFEKAQHRDQEKKLAIECGFNLPEWYKINTIEDLKKYSKKINFDGILKTNTMGYDGKGQKSIKKDTNLEKIWSEIDSNQCILEKKINFVREISIMYGKSADNSDGFFPLSENTHY